MDTTQPPAQSPQPPTGGPPPPGFGVSVPATKGPLLSSGAILALLFLAGFLLVNGFLFVQAQSAQKARATEKTTLSAKVAKLQTPESKAAIEEGKALEGQITGYVQALDGRLVWSQLLGHLQNATYNKAKYNSVTVSQDGTLRVDGETSSFADVAKAFVALRSFKVGDQPGFSDVKLNSVSVAQPAKEGEAQKATFSVSLKIRPDLVADPKSSIQAPKPTASTTPGATPVK